MAEALRAEPDAAGSLDTVALRAEPEPIPAEDACAVPPISAGIRGIPADTVEIEAGAEGGGDRQDNLSEQAPQQAQQQSEYS